MFPLIVPAIGVLTAVIGVYITRARAGESGLTAINRRFYISAVISAVLCAVAAFLYLPGSFAGLDRRERHEVVARMAGANPALHRRRRGDHRHRAGGRHPVADRLLHRHRAQAGQGRRPQPRSPARPPSSCPASRSASSRPSTPRWSSRGAVYGAFLLAPARSRWRCSRWRWPARGLLTTVGVIVAMDTFGPVSDNAQGIAEMSGDVEGEGAQILTELDAVGQHHQGDHQGHRDRHRRAGRDRAVRLLPGRHRAARWRDVEVAPRRRAGVVHQRGVQPRTCWSA